MSEEKTTQEAQPQEDPKITLEDIAVAQRIIQLASSRGAFKAEEMSSVGRVYDRISVFLQHNAPAEEKQEASEEETKTEDGQ